MGIHWSLNILESSEDKEKQTEETARWTAFDTQTYQTFKEETRKEEFIQRCIIAYPVCCATGRNIRKIRRSGNDLLWSVR